MINITVKANRPLTEDSKTQKMIIEKDAIYVVKSFSSIGVGKMQGQFIQYQKAEIEIPNKSIVVTARQFLDHTSRQKL
ncbi:unnamed protein product [Rhizophagus irregularis]|nr:unnamed protein product [Rhizophagus irregularis]